MTQALTTNGAHAETAAAIVEQVVITGTLNNLSPEERVAYYNGLCKSLGLNPLTRPFEYLTLQGKLTLYARKDATEQLRNLRNVSARITAREALNGIYVVTAQAALPNGRTDESIGAVAIDGLRGEALANAMMKAETKAKRRVTLSICGLGVLDETEVDDIPDGEARAWREPSSVTAQPERRQLSPPMSEASAIPRDDTKRDLARFWARATELGYTTPEGKLSKKRVHAALDLELRDGALAEAVAAGRYTYASALTVLEDNDTDVLDDDPPPFDDGEQAPLLDAPHERPISARGA